jgi:hypothetical protein
MTKALFGTHKFLTKLGKILAAQIFQLATLEQVPNLLLRIELRGITWEAFQMQPPGCPRSKKRAF